MAREVEIKFRIRSREPIELRLRALGAIYEGTVREQNTLFDDEKASLRGRDEALRLRRAEALDTRSRSRCTLTWKGPRRPGPMKDREEHESEVAEPDAVRAILLALGLTPTLDFAKRRSTWRWRDAEIVIDEIDHLGSFLEIEAERAAIEVTIEALGLRDPALGAVVEERSYPQLLRDPPTA
jgi:adenylate cyclase class 2